MTDSTCKLCRSYPDRRGGGCRLSRSWAGHLASYGQAASEHCLASTGNDRCPASRHHAIRGHRRRDPLRSLRQPPMKAARSTASFSALASHGSRPHDAAIRGRRGMPRRPLCGHVAVTFCCQSARLLVLPRPPRSCHPLGRGRRVKARKATAKRLGFDSEDSAEIIEQRGGRQFGRPIDSGCVVESLARRSCL